LLGSKKKFPMSELWATAKHSYCSKEFGKDRPQYMNTHEIDLVELVSTKTGKPQLRKLGTDREN
jgi:hypothetical protein